MVPDDLKQMRFSFSQFGEDLFLVHNLGITERKGSGFYVDVGCFDPVLLSNTRLLHMFGWHGANIDASPHAISRFNAARPNDLNILAAISSSKSELEYLEYECSQCNRLVPVGQDIANVLGEHPRRRTRVRSDSLDGILESKGLGQTPIDYLNVDCEGLDEEVIRGGPVAISRADVITIEAHTDDQQRSITDRLGSAGFRLMGRLGPTCIFRRSKG